MKILILNWRDSKNPKSGGAEIATMRHAKAWAKAGHSVTWFTSKFKNSKTVEEIEGVSIVRMGNSITIYLLAPFYYLFGGKNFDLVVDEIHGIPFFTPLYVRKPKIAFIHEVAGEIWNYMYSFPVNIIGKSVESWFFTLYKNVKFMTVSESTKNELINMGINVKNINVILNGLSNNILNLAPKKEKNPTFIFASRIVKMKGVEDVIKSFFYISRKIKAAQLWILGDGDEEYLKKLKAIIGSYLITDKVKFFGHVSDEEKLRLMGKSHLLLHASVKEGWGLVIIEAASQWTPSVVYNVAGLRDSVKDNVTGIVLKKNDPVEMAKQAVELFKNVKMYEDFQKNCLQWAKSLTWEKATQQSLRLVNNIVKR